MAKITGSSTAEIDAPIDEVCAVVEDVLTERVAGSSPAEGSRKAAA